MDDFLLPISLTAFVIWCLIMYLVIKLAVRDALKEHSANTGSVSEQMNHLIDQIEKQNALITLLVVDGKENRKYALIDRETGATKIIDGDDLNKHPLHEFDVAIVEQSKI